MHLGIVFIITQMMGMADSSTTVKQTKMQQHKECFRKTPIPI